MGLSLISCTEKATQSLRKTELNIPVVFILGSEGVGISPELVEISDVHIAIPQSGQINSLNVSVAAGIICYEWYCNSNL